MGSCWNSGMGSRREWPTCVIGGGTAARRQSTARWVPGSCVGAGAGGRTTISRLEVPWSKVLKIGIDVQVDLDAQRTTALAWEHWVRDRIIGRIPGRLEMATQE